MAELIKEREGRLSKEETDKLIAEGYNVVYSENDNKTYYWKSARSEKGGVNGT